MSRIYKERPEIPIPEDGHINHSNGRVYLMDPVTKRRTIIGVAASKTAMHPSDTYRRLFPDLWNEFYSEYNDRNKKEARVGMYGLCREASRKNGLCEVLRDACGEKTANVIMDASMYAILDCLDDKPLPFRERMKNEVTFSPELCSDADLSRVAAAGLAERRHAGFRDRWIRKCAEKGVKEVWLSLAAPDYDGWSGTSRMPENTAGEAPENTASGCIYAVSRDTGEPVACFVNPDGKADPETFREIIDFLKGYGLNVTGVILDSAFYDPDTVKSLKKLKLDYVAALPEDSKEYRKALDSRGEDLCFNPEFLIDGLQDKPISRMTLYGLSEKAPSRGVRSGGMTVNLYYSSEIGIFRGKDFNTALSAAKEQAEEDCSRGRKPVIPENFRTYLKSQENPDGSFSVVCDFAAWRKALRDRGFFALLSSRDFGPRETYELYALRRPAEEQYQILKALEGFAAAEDETDAASHGDTDDAVMMLKYAVCFVSAVLRHEIMTACRNRKLDANDMIREMDEIKLLSLELREYMFMRNISPRAKKLFEEFSLEMEDFDEIARDYSRRERELLKKQEQAESDAGKPRKRKRGFCC